MLFGHATFYDMRYIFQIQIKGFATLAGTAFLSDPTYTYVIYSKGLQTGKKIRVN
jgi:hypothetical protein